MWSKWLAAQQRKPSPLCWLWHLSFFFTLRCRRPPIKWPPSTAGKTKLLSFLFCSQLFPCACSPLLNILAVSPPLLTFAKLPAESAARLPFLLALTYPSSPGNLPVGDACLPPHGANEIRPSASSLSRWNFSPISINRIVFLAPVSSEPP